MVSIRFSNGVVPQTTGHKARFALMASKLPEGVKLTRKVRQNIYEDSLLEAATIHEVLEGLKVLWDAEFITRGLHNSPEELLLITLSGMDPRRTSHTPSWWKDALPELKELGWPDWENANAIRADFFERVDKSVSSI